MNDESPNEQQKAEEVEDGQQQDSQLTSEELHDSQTEEIKDPNGTNSGEEESKEQLNLAIVE